MMMNFFDPRNVNSNLTTKHFQPSSALKPKYAECIFDDERGWTVIQNRYAGEVCFNRDWDEYRMGFGCPVGVGKVPEWYNENADATQECFDISLTS